jgi:ABC-type polysaccharide/polyol phosphate transport system ATPase subunit
MDTIKKYCQRVAYVKHGELKHIGAPEETIAMYLADDNQH